MLSELFGASARTECGPNIELLSLSSPIGIRTRTSALKGPRLKPSVPGTKSSLSSEPIVSNLIVSSYCRYGQDGCRPRYLLRDRQATLLFVFMTKNIAFHLAFATLLGLLLYAETLSYVLPFLYRLYVLASHRTYTALIQSKTFIVESNHKEHEL